MSEEPLPEEGTETIAATLREVADEIENEDTFGSVRGDADTTQWPGGFLVYGKELSGELKTPRFGVEFEIYDEDP